MREAEATFARPVEPSLDGAALAGNEELGSGESVRDEAPQGAEASVPMPPLPAPPRNIPEQVAESAKRVPGVVSGLLGRLRSSINTVAPNNTWAGGPELEIKPEGAPEKTPQTETVQTESTASEEIVREAESLLAEADLTTPEQTEPALADPGPAEPEVAAPELAEPELAEPELPALVQAELAPAGAAVIAGEELDAAIVPDANADETPDLLASKRVSAEPGAHDVVLTISGLKKSYGDTVAVDSIDLEVEAGSFYGIVGPNGAGKTTTLSMVTGLLRPDSGTVHVHNIDVWKEPVKAKRTLGVLPDRMRLFDRLTGAQLLYYSGVLRGLDSHTTRARVKSLARAFNLEDALGRLVSDYSAGMSKKISLAAALIHSPRILILDEPFEAVDPVSASTVIEILQKYVENGGTVVLSSHSMDFIQRVCDHVAIIVNGQVLAHGSVDEVRDGGSLEEKFIELAGGRKVAEGMEWLHSFSD